jgi:hypothetical protein
MRQARLRHYQDMKRRLLNLATGLSLLLCVTALGLWVRARYAAYYVGFSFPQGWLWQVSAGSAGGRTPELVLRGTREANP